MKPLHLDIDVTEHTRLYFRPLATHPETGDEVMQVFSWHQERGWPGSAMEGLCFDLGQLPGRVWAVWVCDEVAKHAQVLDEAARGFSLDHRNHGHWTEEARALLTDLRDDLVEKARTAPTVCDPVSWVRADEQDFLREVARLGSVERWAQKEVNRVGDHLLDPVGLLAAARAYLEAEVDEARRELRRLNQDKEMLHIQAEEDPTEDYTEDFAAMRDEIYDVKTRIQNLRAWLKS